MAFKVAVCGGKKFADFKLVHRALDAVHKKHFITTLITGGDGGAEEMAYFWAVNRHVREIITVPMTPDLLGKLSRERRANDLLAEYMPNVVVAFPYQRPNCLAFIAERRGFTVWEVPPDFRG